MVSNKEGEQQVGRRSLRAKKKTPLLSETSEEVKEEEDAAGKPRVIKRDQKLLTH
jgi:hypothetical protein